jgi:hypothetical protein
VRAPLAGALPNNRLKLTTAPGVLVECVEPLRGTTPRCLLWARSQLNLVFGRPGARVVGEAAG